MEQETDVEDLKGIAVAILSAALHSRERESVEERIQQYGEDIGILINELDYADLYRLCSLLADMGAFLVGVLAEHAQVEKTAMMEHIAKNMMDAPTTETEL